MVCSECKNTIKDGTKFCPYCGCLVQDMNRNNSIDDDLYKLNASISEPSVEKREYMDGRHTGYDKDNRGNEYERSNRKPDEKTNGYGNYGNRPYDTDRRDYNNDYHEITRNNSNKYQNDSDRYYRDREDELAELNRIASSEREPKEPYRRQNEESDNYRHKEADVYYEEKRTLDDDAKYRKKDTEDIIPGNPENRFRRRLRDITEDNTEAPPEKNDSSTCTYSERPYLKRNTDVYIQEDEIISEDDSIYAGTKTQTIIGFVISIASLFIFQIILGAAGYIILRNAQNKGCKSPKCKTGRILSLIGFLIGVIILGLGVYFYINMKNYLWAMDLFATFGIPVR